MTKQITVYLDRADGGTVRVNEDAPELVYLGMPLQYGETAARPFLIDKDVAMEIGKALVEAAS